LVVLDVCLDVLDGVFDGVFVVLTGLFFFCVPIFKKLVWPFFKEGFCEEENGADLEGG